MITGRLKEWMEAMKAMQQCQVSLNQSGTKELSGLKTHAHKQTLPHTHRVGNDVSAYGQMRVNP